MLPITTIPTKGSNLSMIDTGKSLAKPESIGCRVKTMRAAQIAKTPNFFQRKCIRSTAEYKGLDSKSLAVHNTCYQGEGKITDIEGKATILKESAPSKLEVQFKVFLINPKGDYWITELDPDYQWAVVSGPGMKYNFVLARTFPMKEDTKKNIFELLKSKNYPVSEFIFDGVK